MLIENYSIVFCGRYYTQMHGISPYSILTWHYRVLMVESLEKSGLLLGINGDYRFVNGVRRKTSSHLARSTLDNRAPPSANAALILSTIPALILVLLVAVQQCYKAEDQEKTCARINTHGLEQVQELQHLPHNGSD